MSRIYFTDFFEVAPDTLESYGAFDVSLINDLPLFVDPFLLFDSKRPEYTALHEEIIRYVRFLRDRATEDHLAGTLDHWFRFPEVKQNWLGFSKAGNRGSGLGRDFAESLQKNLRDAFRNFGDETVSRGSHLEKLCLIEGGVGRDHISDFATNIIKGFLLAYTQRFAKANLKTDQLAEVAVDKVRFDYDARRWRGGTFDLPTWMGDYVLLTPKDILTKDEAWISRSDLIHRLRYILPSLPNAQLRDQLSEYFRSRLGKNATAKDEADAARSAIARFPAVLDHYIREREDHGAQAQRVSVEKVRETESVFVGAIKALVDQYLAGTDFYRAGDSFTESLRRIAFLKDVIENKDGYRVFYVKGRLVRRETDLQLMFRLIWFGSDHDVNREVNNGRGPVDFKISRGSADTTLVEFKLASNSKLEQNLKHQVGAYEAANNTAKSIKVIMYCTEREHVKVTKILKNLALEGRPDVVLIDACSKKPSASNIADEE